MSLGNNVIPLLPDLLEYRGQHDFFRKNVAIKVLAILKDDRIVPTLRSEIAKEEHRNHLEQELLAILKHNASDEMVDYVADVIAKQKSSSDQEYIISFLSQSELSNRAKMRLYSHYEQFRQYGKHATIRGLAKIDDEAALRRLVRILRQEKYGHAFRVAAYELSKLKNYDPGPVFLEVLTKAPDRVCRSLIVPIAERDYIPAIPILEERIAKANKYAEAVRCKIWAAGALCKLGKDYEKNATIVRQYLKKDYDPHHAGHAPYGAAGWLSDKETVNILVSKIVSEQPSKYTVEWAIRALGQIGHTSALPALRDLLTRLPCDRFAAVGEAIERIGRKNGDQTITEEGWTVQLVARYLHNLGGQQKGLRAGSPEAERMRRERAQVVDWLKRNSGVIPSIIAQSRSAWNRRLIERLMEAAQ